MLLVSCYHVPVTGRNAFVLTSVAQENQLGAQAFEQVLAQTPRSSDMRATALVERVGKRIAQASNEPDFKWEFVLLDSPEKNAFCLPGGKVAVYSGILPIAKNEAGLAVIVGHEVAHATARHAGQRISMMLGEQVGVEGLSLLLGGQGDPTKAQLLLGALGLGAKVGLELPFSRKQEAEADQIGLHYTAQAGYDPREAPKLWQRMHELAGSGVPTFLSDHPSSASREKALEAELPQVMPLYEKSPRFGLGDTL